MKTIVNLPTELDDITPDWFSNILKTPVNPSTWKSFHNVHDGTGFLSLMARIEFEDEANEKHNYIVKLLPSMNSSVESAREIVLNDKFDKIEIESYRELLPKLTKEFPVLENYICKAIYAEIQNEDVKAGIPYSSVIVMEDLKPMGYSTIHFTELINEKIFYQGLDFLGNFHVSSLCLEKKAKSSLPNIYPWSVNWYNPDTYEESKLPGLFSLLPGAIPFVFQVLERNSKDHLMPIFKKIGANMNDILIKILRKGQQHPCLIHGDLWPHNFLIHQDKPIKVIDWQLLGYTDPTYDLACYIISTLNAETLDVESVEKALVYYYNLYEKLCKQHGLTPSRTWEEFKKQFYTYGIGFAQVWAMSGGECLANMKCDGNDKLVKIYELFETLKAQEFLVSLI